MGNKTLENLEKLDKRLDEDIKKSDLEFYDMMKDSSDQ